MDNATRAMILRWLDMHHGDAEGLAVWMRDCLRMPIRFCREAIRGAQGGQTSQVSR